MVVRELKDGRSYVSLQEDHAELAAQFASFTKDIVKPSAGSAAPDEPGRPRPAFLGIF